MCPLFQQNDLDQLQVCRLLEARQTDPVALKTFCAEHGVSVYTLNRLFQKWLGQSPRRWQRRLRLNEAAILLGRTDQSVLSIAQTVGYESQQSFCRAFLREWGVNPTCFRRRFREQHGDLPSQSARVPVTHGVLPPLRIISQRFVGDYDQVPRYWQAFGRKAAQAMLNSQPGVFVGVTWDDPDVTPVGEIRYDCGFLPRNSSVLDQIPTGADLTHQNIAGGAYAALAGQGHYHELVPDRYQQLVCQWLPSSGWQLDLRPAIEWFAEAPWRMPEHEWRFEIRLPIA